MPMLLVVLTTALGLIGLVAGALTVRTWNPDNDPDYLRDVVHQGVVAFLKIGLLILLATVAVIAVVGSLAAHRGSVGIPRGVWVCAVLTWIIAASFLLHYLRQRARRDAGVGVPE